MEIKKIMVIGAGQMGSGIAQVCAVSGFEVFLQDLSEEYVKKGLVAIENNLLRQVEKGRINEQEKIEILGRLTPST